ncbi:hypothetical protein [Escherichia coli]|uniref:hypothetical protein n=1 Tax=Escherichia coli TaxID=562 RepID=UPI0007E8E26E
MVDINLEKFFDRVDHRLLMTRLASTIKDRRGLRLIRRYLKEEIVRDGQREKWQEGMPQGGHCCMVSGRRREQTEAESE